jgi:predicted nucleic acid-binding protein
MIHLDTNYLIGVAVSDSKESHHVDQWLAEGRSLATSAIAWTEFLNGPVQQHEISLVEAIIESQIVPFDRAAAVLAADLFNRTGRRRGSRFDCLIASTAILSGAEIASANESDFRHFANYGLKLAVIPRPTSL